MILKREQLTHHLQENLLPIYVVHGNEPLLVDQACAQIRQAAKQAGFADRHRYELNAQFDWQAFLQDSQQQSLFGEKRIADCHHPNTTVSMGQKGSKALKEYCAHLPPDQCLLLKLPKLDRAQQQSAWCRNLTTHGALITIWPLQRDEYPAWIRSRAQTLKINVSDDAIPHLIEQHIGCLSALDQTLEKFSLSQPGGTLTATLLVEHSHDQAQFDVFALSQAYLSCDQAQSLRILQRLRYSDTAPSLVIWALHRDLRLIWDLQHCPHSQHRQLLQKQKIWAQQQPLLLKACKRFAQQSIEQHLRWLARADEMVKGMCVGDPWQAFDHIILKLCPNHG